jgi:hypothetical protein
MVSTLFALPDAQLYAPFVQFSTPFARGLDEQQLLQRSTLQVLLSGHRIHQCLLAIRHQQSFPDCVLPSVLTDYSHPFSDFLEANPVDLTMALGLASNQLGHDRTSL